MEKISQLPLSQEIVFGSSDSAISQAIRRAVKAGQLRKIAPRLYTNNLQDAPSAIVRRNAYLILGTLFPNAVISHRSALEGGIAADNSIILTYKYTKKISLPGLTINLVTGPKAQSNDMPFMEHLFMASRVRALLENLQITRTQKGFRKTLTRVEIETYLDKLSQIYGVTELNRLRDEARELATTLHFNREFKLLEQLIGALLGTQNVKVLNSPVGLARATGVPYDSQRLELFANLVAHLQTTLIPVIEESNITKDSLRNLAFFEAYFSNYIEGTEFEVNEAADIVFHQKLIPNRPEDAHDVLGTFQIVSNTAEMMKVPHSSEELMSLLQKRHQVLMSVRHDKEPGKFKTLSNRVGNTTFVAPELVRGTLIKAFDLYQQLHLGLARAIFIMFIVSEIHPFLDGNGRIARIMMNAELVCNHENRIIIPTVYREDYLLTLRRLSRECDPDAYIRMLIRAQAFTASIDFSDYQKALVQLQEANAFLQPFEGKLKF